MEMLGYIVCLLVGLSLGLIGAGGGILTVPVMVYLFHIPVLLSTTYSLFIVGAASLVGAWYQYRRDHVNLRIAVIFCLLSMSVVFVIRHYLLPRIPGDLFVVSGVTVTMSFLCMVMFSMLMILVALAMILKKQPGTAGAEKGRSNLHILWCAILVGLLTGFLGAGGGFILIPSLVLFLGLSMKDAVGTSLLIIAMNSLTGFTMDLNHVTIQWPLLAGITLIAAGGLFLGTIISKRISAEQLKLFFGWFVLAVAVGILIKELTTYTR